MTVEVKCGRGGHAKAIVTECGHVGWDKAVEAEHSH